MTVYRIHNIFARLECLNFAFTFLVKSYFVKCNITQNKKQIKPVATKITAK